MGVSGSGLKDTDPDYLFDNGEPDPKCSIRVIDDTGIERLSFSAGEISGTRNPTWNKEYQFEWRTEYAYIEFKVTDVDTDENDNMGTAYLFSHQFLQNGMDRDVYLDQGGTLQVKIDVD